MLSNNDPTPDSPLPTPLIDIGVNLMSPAFDRDREAVIARVEAAGLKALIITGNDIESSAGAAVFATAFAVKNAKLKCKSTAGVHPHNAKDWNERALARMEELVAQKSLPKGVIVAVGECGLDYNRNFSPQDAQRKCFEDQLKLAAKIGKPVFLHERDAFADFFSILKQYKADLPGAVVHCFTGGQPELEAYLSIDCYIGITGWVCDERRGGRLIPLLAAIPADRLLLETDAPYLLPRSLPRSVRGKSGRNEPCFLPHIAASVAAILGKTPGQIAEETSANAERFFGLQKHTY
jgi:TatD DNase family protein